MRVWDIPAHYLCRQHLLAQHLEIHTIFSVIYNKKKGYSKHPETLRWINKLDQLKLMHELTVREMQRRQFNHKSPLPDNIPIAKLRDNYGVVDPIWRQIHEIYRKGCACNLDGMYLWYEAIRDWPSERDNDVF